MSALIEWSSPSFCQEKDRAVKTKVCPGATVQTSKLTLRTILCLFSRETRSATDEKSRSSCTVESMKAKLWQKERRGNLEQGERRAEQWVLHSEPYSQLGTKATGVLVSANFTDSKDLSVCLLYCHFSGLIFICCCLWLAPMLFALCPSPTKFTIK